MKKWFEQFAENGYITAVVLLVYDLICAGLVWSLNLGWFWAYASIGGAITIVIISGLVDFTGHEDDHPMKDEIR